MVVADLVWPPSLKSFALSIADLLPEHFADLADGCFGSRDERHIGEAVDQLVIRFLKNRHLRGRKFFGVGVTLVAQGVEAGGDDDRRWMAREIFGAQR